MKILKVRGYTITAWAEKLGDRWQGLASVTRGYPTHGLAAQTETACSAMDCTAASTPL